MDDDAAREKIIDKIRKLLDVSAENGASENEALQAALIAQRYIAEYDIKDFEINSSPDRILTVESMAVRGEWKGSLGAIIADNFRCRAYMDHLQPEPGSKKSRICVVFYGYETDAKAAACVFNYLYRVADEMAKAASRPYWGMRTWWGESVHNDIYKSYIDGFLYGVKNELEKQTEALMLVIPSEVKDSYEEFSKDFRTARRKRYSYLEELGMQGYRDGQEAIQKRRMNDSGGNFELPS
ncbi:MAG: DUF2786 domain-containing protein [Eggerthellaceae bacterium]|nr:DUF2786 domain-containing protein [Eggerthellaceae bacterium]